MKRWYPDEEVKNYVIEYGGQIRGYMIEDLWNRSEFYDAGKNFGMGGITFSKKMIRFSSDIVSNCEHKIQASIIYHELVHVSQQLSMGWTNFMATYLGQWTRAGFKYEKMKEKGLEHEAYGKEEMFYFKIKDL